MAIWGEKVYVPAIMGASGITKEQAKTCLYYAVATYLIPDELKRIPLLTIQGPQGTGKTNLLNQMAKMVNKPKKITAQTPATLRDSLNNTTTALIDEGDQIIEDLLIRRYDVKTSSVIHNIPLGGNLFRRMKANIFGATIIVRRTPFQDPALTSRSLIVKTQYKPGTYKIKQLKKAREDLPSVAEEVELADTTSDRIRDNWMPLQAVAEYLEDEEWIEYSNNVIEKSLKSFIGSQRYEPEQALLIVLRENMTSTELSIENDVELSTIRNELKTVFDIHMKNSQIEVMCRDLGFIIRVHRGYPRVKANVKRLKRLLKERNI